MEALEEIDGTLIGVSDSLPFGVVVLLMETGLQAVGVFGCWLSSFDSTLCGWMGVDVDVAVAVVCRNCYCQLYETRHAPMNIYFALARVIKF